MLESNTSERNIPCINSATVSCKPYQKYIMNDLYQNPIIPGFNPDPSIIRCGPDFFLVTSSFEYFPGVPIYHSKDLIKWELIGHVLTRRSQLDVRTPEPGGGIWAATIRQHNGRLYVMTCCFDRYRPQEDDRVPPRGFYTYTDDIWKEDSWSDPVYFDQVGFDQDVSWNGTIILSTSPLDYQFSDDIYLVVLG